jgi:hypothetical protein
VRLNVSAKVVDGWLAGTLVRLAIAQCLGEILAFRPISLGTVYEYWRKTCFEE